jgi:LuxR family maltose regulon positive regulatory protein
VLALKNHDKFLEDLKTIVREKPSQELFDYIEENITYFFSTPFISSYYQILKDIDMSKSTKILPKLIKAWLAFLCGDNAGLHTIMRHIDEMELRGHDESSFYYALKAITGFYADYQERLKYAKLSIDILPEGDCSIYMANAKLTFAQIISGLDQYRSAKEIFDDSYRMFYSLDIHFPAVVALANKLLNMYKLGEFRAVIDECNKVLVMSASFRDEVSDYWNIIHLPLGMCYFEMNKPSLAVQHLKHAKECIDRIKLFHMHGLIELYLFKSYFILNDNVGMEEIKAQALADFGNMHYIMTDLLICMFRIMSCESDSNLKLQPDIERFELEYMKSGTEKSHFILIETLAFLKINGLSDVITTNDIVKSLEKLRFIGMIPNIQLFLILLAELHFMENKQENAAEALKEAAAIYHEYGISVSFYTLPLKSIHLLQNIDQQLYNEIIKKSHHNNSLSGGSILSAREKEIMQLIAMGKGNEEISQALFISVGTTKWHINHIFAKLEVRNRIQAAQKAKLLGEIS